MNFNLLAYSLDFKITMLSLCKILTYFSHSPGLSHTTATFVISPFYLPILRLAPTFFQVISLFLFHFPISIV